MDVHRGRADLFKVMTVQRTTPRPPTTPGRRGHDPAALHADTATDPRVTIRRTRPTAASVSSVSSTLESHESSWSAMPRPGPLTIAVLDHRSPRWGPPRPRPPNRASRRRRRRRPDARPWRAAPPLPPATPAVAAGPDMVKRLYAAVAPSLVAVQFTFTGEVQQADVVLARVVVDDGRAGPVPVPAAVTSSPLPDEQLKQVQGHRPAHRTRRQRGARRRRSRAVTSGHEHGLGPGQAGRRGRGPQVDARPLRHRPIAGHRPDGLLRSASCRAAAGTHVRHLPVGRSSRPTSAAPIKQEMVCRRRPGPLRRRPVFDETPDCGRRRRSATSRPTPLSCWTTRNAQQQEIGRGADHQPRVPRPDVGIQPSHAGRPADGPATRSPCVVLRPDGA